MNGDHFSRFEAHIQRLIEGGFARLFAGRLHPREVAIRLARAMEDEAVVAADGAMRAPDVYLVRLHPLDHRAIIESGEDVTTRLSDELVELARASGLRLARRPDVRLLADETVSPHEVEIAAQHAPTNRETTQAMPLARLQDVVREAEERQATLIVNGDRHVTLDKPVVNLGRQRDNDIIIDDPTVSRHHAQIRLRFGSYVLFDLGSRGGTTVNGYRVQERVLQPGDVIGLAHNSTCVYVEDGVVDDGDDPMDDTEAYPPLRP